MSIVVRFTPASLTREQYDETVRRMQETGIFPPEGMDYHVCFGEEGRLRVSEIWDSREQWQAFGSSSCLCSRTSGSSRASRTCSRSTTSSSAPDGLGTRQAASSPVRVRSTPHRLRPCLARPEPRQESVALSS